MKPTPYNGCAAYTKNHVKCGAYVVRAHDNETRYCPIHKNYARDWFAKHPPLYGLYRPDIVRRSRVVKEYIEQFRTEAIVPSRYYVYNIAADAGNYLYYYLLCEHSPSVDPLWNRRLFKDVLWFQYRRALDAPKYVGRFFEACRVLAKTLNVYTSYLICCSHIQSNTYWRTLGQTPPMNTIVCLWTCGSDFLANHSSDK